MINEAGMSTAVRSQRSQAQGSPQGAPGFGEALGAALDPVNAATAASAPENRPQDPAMAAAGAGQDPSSAEATTDAPPGTALAGAEARGQTRRPRHTPATDRQNARAQDPHSRALTRAFTPGNADPIQRSKPEQATVSDVLAAMRSRRALAERGAEPAQGMAAPAGGIDVGAMAAPEDIGASTRTARPAPGRPDESSTPPIAPLQPQTPAPIANALPHGQPGAAAFAQTESASTDDGTRDESAIRPAASRSDDDAPDAPPGPVSPAATADAGLDGRLNGAAQPADPAREDDPSVDPRRGADPRSITGRNGAPGPEMMPAANGATVPIAMNTPAGMNTPNGMSVPAAPLATPARNDGDDVAAPGRPQAGHARSASPLAPETPGSGMPAFAAEPSRAQGFAAAMAALSRPAPEPHPGGGQQEGASAAQQAMFAAAGAGAPSGAGQTFGPAAPVAAYTLPTPLQDAAFPGALAGQLEQVVLNGIGNAEILITPPDMGPIRVELSLNGENASLAFSAAQPETRQAIEQSLPILRTMLADNGILLGDASVDQGRNGRAGLDADASAQRDSNGNAPGSGARSGTGHGAGDASTADRPRSTARARAGLLDLYA